MSEGKDPAIKLFGTTIQVPEIPEIGADCGGGGGGGAKSEDRSSSSSSSSDANSEGVGEEHESNDYNEDADEEKSIDKERAHSPSATSMLNDNLKPPASAAPKTSKMEEEGRNCHEKSLKKPDKILPCPRCNSMDTKFCYYNNHNVNQPRHFCKKCQRYWTAGGTMRNVPVGAGRRKNKTLSSQYHQITITKTEDSTTQLSSNDDQNSNTHGFQPQLPCFPNGLWPYPWHPQTGHAFGPPGFQMPLYPAPPYWACFIPGPWNHPWVAPQFSSPDSSNLGKRPRDGEDEERKEKCLWIPKTLRIDDPDEAAKSSIWTTLGINKDRSDSVNGGGIFKAFRSKGEETTRTPMKVTSYILQANPAALSRSLNFQETS